MTPLRVMAALVVVLAGWIGTMAAVMFFTDAAPAAVVLLPGPDFLARLPEDSAILARTRFSVTVESDVPGLGRRLYAAGATLVLPAGLTGCLPLPDRRPGT